jgi:hypothetical protein
MDILEGGRIRLTLDDLQSTEDDQHAWEKRCLFTYFDMSEMGARTFQLDHTEYASIGEAILARLLALDSIKGGD